MTDTVRQLLRRWQQAYNRMDDSSGCGMDVTDFQALRRETHEALRLPPPMFSKLPLTTDELEALVIESGMVSLLRMGSGSCVHSEGCCGVAQADLEKFVERVAVHLMRGLTHPEDTPS